MIDDKLKTAAVRAGIVDTDALRMVDTTNVADPKAFIADLKKAKPYLFARDMRTMGDAEYKEARRGILQRAREAIFPPRTPSKHIREMTNEEYAAEKGRLGLRHRGPR